MLLLFTLLFSLIYCLPGLNLTHYQVEVKSTNPLNVSSFEECLCQCLNYFNCSYFAYWSSILISTCQLYTSSDDKPQILNYSLPNNDNQTGVYLLPSSIINCRSSSSSLAYNFSINASSYIPMSAQRIISVLIMSINNQNQLVAVDSNDASYYIFDLNTLQMIDTGILSITYGELLCARQYSNLLYIGYAQNIIEVRQFNPVMNSSTIETQLLYTFSTSIGGSPQCLAVLNQSVLYYVVAPNSLYVLLTQSNTSKYLYTFIGVGFSSPSILIVLDSINMQLFLANNAGTLFRVELSSINTDNGTSIISSGLIDQYQMPLNIATSLFLDKYNRLWAFSVLSGIKPQMLVFIQEYSGRSFSTMNIINFTNFLPTFPYTPYNFEFDDNYTLYTANCNQGISVFFHP